MSELNTASTPTRMLSIKQTARAHSAFSEGSIRRRIFDGELDDVICRVGRRVVIDEAKFIAWVRAQGAAV